MKKLVAISLVLFSQVAFAQSILKFKVEGMDCPFCASKVEKELDKLSGLIDYEFDMDKEALSVKIKDSSVASEKIINAIKRAGYVAKEESGQEE